MSDASQDDDFSAIAAEAMAQSQKREPRTDGMLSRLAAASGWIWMAASAIAILIYVRPENLAFTPLPVLLLMGAGVVLPALMMWFAGSAAREAAQARLAAKKLADATERLLAPGPAAEASARKLAASVRVEISALDRALDQTLVKLKEVQSAINHQQAAVDKISTQAQQSGGRLVSGLERERAELLQIADDLNKHADLIGQSISKHTAVIAQAAEIAETEVKAADSALEQKLASFGAAAALINDRTVALDSAAQSSAESTLRLEQALSNALDVLSRATSLTDSARQSADAALSAARSTADALQETTARAIEDARRAADIVRGESARVERDAAAALDRLGSAAQDARRSAFDTRDAVRSSEPPARREALEDRFEAAPPRRERRDGPREERPDDRRDDRRDERVRPANADTPSFTWSPAAPRPRPPEHADQDGDWSWRALLSNIDDDAPAQGRRERGGQRPAERGGARTRAPSGDPVARLAHSVAEQRDRTASPIVAVIDAAGVRLADAFSAGALDRVAQRARNGTQSRRKAVKDAAPEAVRKVTDFLANNQDARAEAANFLKGDGARIAELMGRGRGAMGSEATRAFLLVDAAFG
ncbi:MAG: hypothetical protein GC189_10195 [Alphaproteobacteria bacterium]|nr:hypothetical protein [Alphaproteobacteria bacterium]